METVSLKLDGKTAKEICEKMREFNYSTKTELIREAIRDKLKKLEEENAKRKAWEALFASRGALKGKGKFKTEEEWHNWRSNVFSKELMEYYDKKFSQK